MSTAGRCITGVMILVSMSGAVPASAQLPLSIDELLVEQHALKLQTAFTYTNSDVPWSAALHPHQDLGKQQQQTRVSALTSRLRYGVHRNLEINASATKVEVDSRGLGGSGREDQYAVAVGANWLISVDTLTPAVLLTAAVDVLETSWLHPGERYHGKAARLGANIYRAIDPVVLSLAISQEWRLEREFAGISLDPGDVLTLRPQVNFAVNHRVTLTGGVSWQRRAGDRLDGIAMGHSRHHTGLAMGLGLLASEHSTIFVDSHVFTSGDKGASLSVEWLYRF